jgi:hypothetical protein
MFRGSFRVELEIDVKTSGSDLSGKACEKVGEASEAEVCCNANVCSASRNN